MESTVKRGPWLEEEFTKEGESYIVNDGYVEGFRASITPREGFFDVEVYRNESEYERDDDIGIYVAVHREEYLNSRELTVDNIRTAIRDFELTVPDSLANELTEWQGAYWDGNEIEKGHMPEGAEAPEETSERLRLEFGSALAEAQGIAKAESAIPDLDRWDLINRAHTIENSESITEAGAAEWANLQSQLTNLERSSLSDDHAQGQSVEVEDGEDNSFSF